MVEIAAVVSEEPEKHGSNLQPTTMVDGDVPPPDTTISDPLEMWLNY